MEGKTVKLTQKKNGAGYVTSYTFNIGCAEAKSCGFINEDGTTKPLVKIVDADTNSIIIKVESE